MNLQDNVQDRKLGDYSLRLSRFPDLKAALHALKDAQFLHLLEKDRIDKINQLLLRLIKDVEAPCFLLAAVNEFICSVNEFKWVGTYTFSQFEFWLNHFSGLSGEENYFIRAKIMGKYTPREGYQTLFPIGMGKVYPGSHYVTAHGSPDLDTTIASFWGWVDAFSARVGTGLHVWNVPGGPPESQVEIEFLFYRLLGPKCFDHFAKTRTSLALSAIDLVSQKGAVRKDVQDSSDQLNDEKNQHVILVDPSGYYLGDFGQLDKEGVRKVTTLLHSCMRWFISCFQRELTSVFSQKVVTKRDVAVFVEKLFSFSIEESDPAKEFTDKQKDRMNTYLIKVLQVQKGMKSSFKELWDSMQLLSLVEFSELFSLLEKLPFSNLFDEAGVLLENRPVIFACVEEIVVGLEKAITSLRMYVDRLGVAFSIKKEVFGCPPQGVSHRAEIEEIRSKLGSLSSLTVTISDAEEKEHPIGIVKSADLNKPILGTVSLRDFCNRDETKIPSYFEVISIVDHHKTSLQTSSAPVATIADAQSANVLVAELSFKMNDPYSTLGSSAKELQDLFSLYNASKGDPSLSRIIQKLLHKQSVHEKKMSYFIDSSREYLEYLHYLYAILDDTDLLSKVSYRDVVCVASLLNRLKTLSLSKEVEIISFDDLEQDEKFVAKAALKILQNEDMYSLYKKIYTFKEEAVEKSLHLCSKGDCFTMFADTKVQNGCNRVGQTKLFAKNFPAYALRCYDIYTVWYKEAKKFYEESPECDLHMHMVSTVPSADDMHAGNQGSYAHQDELWIWIPMEEQAIGRLKSFLDAFRHSPQIVSSEMEVEFLGDNEKSLERIFHESFKSIVKKPSSSDKKISVPVAVLRYRAGLLNSRKAMISPYLPKITQ
ncbi:MAG: hypothetical protein V4489_04300 [Chlamydiota bacterium]